MLFIWSFVYINKSNDKINQAFLVFLGSILLWMIMDRLNIHIETSLIGVTLKTIYFISMLNMSVFFLYFTYRLIKKKLDIIFLILVFFNTKSTIKSSPHCE